MSILKFLCSLAKRDAENSTWKFLLTGHPEECPGAWFHKDFNDDGWDSVQLPNHWQLQGYDITNISYPFQRRLWLSAQKNLVSMQLAYFAKPSNFLHLDMSEPVCCKVDRY